MAQESAVTALPPAPPAAPAGGPGREGTGCEAAPARHRNRRGEGTRLREEIVRAAVEIIERTGSDQALTLRSVAREVGIAAPSIYAHFADREAIVEAVIIESLGHLRDAVLSVVSRIEDPVEALLAGCAAYVAFGAREPARYRLLFGSPRGRSEDPDCPPKGQGMLAFATLVDGVEACVEAGRSASEDPFGDAVALWTALHGQVTLRASQPDFPWPPTDTVAQLARRLGRILPES